MMMARVSETIRLLVGIGLVCGVGLPQTVSAQGTMTFGEEEAKEVQEEDEEESSSSKGSGQNQGEGMTFDTDTSVENQKGSSTPVVGLVAVPSDAMSSTQRQTLKKKLVSSMEAVRDAKDLKLSSGTSVIQSLRKRNVSSCVTEPLCLGSVGTEAGVTRIMMARVDKSGNALQLDLDYFNVSDKLFVEYKSVKNLGTFQEVVDAVEPSIKEMFDLETRPDGPDPVATKSRGKALRIIGITSGGISLAALATGVIFGTRANSLESELKNKRESDGTYTITQTKAQRMFDDAQNRASLATGFYIAGGVLAATGGVLYFVGASQNSGTETPPPKQQASNTSSLTITPTAGEHGVGLRAQFQF